VALVAGAPKFIVQGLQIGSAVAARPFSLASLRHLYYDVIELSTASVALRRHCLGLRACFEIIRIKMFSYLIKHIIHYYYFYKTSLNCF
jgi:hypothetical protein